MTEWGTGKEWTLTENDVQGEWTLPEGWAWTTIGEITQPIEKVKPRDNPDEHFTYLDISSINNKSNRVVEPKAYYGAEAPSRARQLVRANDVLFSTVRTYLRNIALVPEAYDGQIASTGFSILRGEPGVSPKYLFYYALTDRFLSELGKLQRGTSYPAVRDGDVRAQPIPLASPPEQRRIVAEIETQFTRLDAAVVGLERAQANIRRYKAAVLRAACEGRLVPMEAELARAEGHAYEPADRLLARILAERRAKWEAENPGKKCKEPTPPDTENLPELPEGWVWVGFDSLLREPLRNGRSAKASQSDDGIRTLTLTAVTLGDFSLENTKLTVADPSKVKDLWIQPGDLFIERSNTPELVGTARLYRGKPNFAIFPDLLIRARVVDKVSARYIEVVLQSEPTRSYFKRSAQGISGTMPKISQSTVRNLSVPLPPLAEQRRIVAEVERRLSVVVALEREVEAALTRAARLRQSILKRAFEGRLVPQDPNDEPASELLKRIKASRERLQEEQRRRRAAERRQKAKQEKRREINIRTSSELRELLRQLQQQTDGPIPVDQLLEVSKLMIEDFHILLKEEIQSGRIREHRDGYRAFLEMANENQEHMD